MDRIIPGELGRAVSFICTSKSRTNYKQLGRYKVDIPGYPTLRVGSKIFVHTAINGNLVFDLEPLPHKFSFNRHYQVLTFESAQN